MHVVQQKPNFKMKKTITENKDEPVTPPWVLLGVLIFPAMFTSADLLAKRSDPLTPRVNCFHF